MPCTTISGLPLTVSTMGRWWFYLLHHLHGVVAEVVSGWMSCARSIFAMRVPQEVFYRTSIHLYKTNEIGFMRDRALALFVSVVARRTNGHFLRA